MIPKFTEKEYQEILKARERLAKLKVKDYGYPLEPKEEVGEDAEEEPGTKYKSIYFKLDRGALELNRKVIELENSNQYLIRKIKEITEYASKRKHKDII